MSNNNKRNNKNNKRDNNNNKHLQQYDLFIHCCVITSVRK